MRSSEGQNQEYKDNQLPNEADQLIQKRGSQHKRHGKRQQKTAETDFWASWNYTPEEWLEFDRLDWKPVARKGQIFFSVALPLCIIVTVLVAFLLHQILPRPDISYWIGVLITSFFLVPFPAFFVWFLRFNDSIFLARERHQARLNGEQRVTIGIYDHHSEEQNIWLGGQRFLLLDGWHKLDKVYLTYNPPVLHLGVRYASRGVSIHGQRSSASSYDTFHILIPRQYEEEAKKLPERFQFEVIKAEERRQKRLRAFDVPEPGQDRS